MIDLQSYVASLVVLAMFALTGWLVSIRMQDVSVVDSLWSLMILVVPLVAVTAMPEWHERLILVVILAALWAVRLSVYISVRNHGKPEDYRYQAIRRNNEPHFEFKSLYLVFGLQAVLAWIVALPLHAAAVSATPLSWLDAAGVVLWLTGFLFEAIGDAQLASFKAGADNAGRVMDKGLWRYTRHPNYFGECCLWWGFYLIALGGGAWWSILSPLLMTFLLLKVSGVAMLEKDISERRPAYRDYARRTSAFFPWPPARNSC